jgi:hypothetical protein
MATASSSSGLHGVHKRLRPDLPLILVVSRWRPLPVPRACMEFISDWGHTSLSFHAASVKKEGANKGRIFYTCLDCNVSVFCHVCLCFTAIFVMILINGFLIWCSNFSEMALDHVVVGTGRKSMLRMSKSILRSRRLRQLRQLMRLQVSMMMRQLASRRSRRLTHLLMRVQVWMMKQWASRRSPSMICLF